MVTINQSSVTGNDPSIIEFACTLPKPETTTFDYDPITVHQRMAYLAGQIPKHEGKIAYSGLVGDEVSLEDLKRAARICTKQALAWLNHSAGGLNNVERILRLKCFVAHIDGFTQISEVADAASNLLREVFGEAGRHSRAVIGVKSLPRQCPVLIEMTVALHEPV